MTDGLMLTAGAGTVVPATGMTLKVGDGQSASWSVFDVEVTPGFDVGAHLHHHAEEYFYVLDGELDLLAFEPRVRTAGNWQDWESASGARVLRGRRGDSMFVPAGCPHAFANPGTAPARMIFVVSPPGHEHYLAEIGKAIGQGGRPDPAVIAEIRARHDIEQITPMAAGQQR